MEKTQKFPRKTGSISPLSLILFSDLQSCAALFPWSPLIWIVSGGIGAGLGYLIGDTCFAVNSATGALFAANATNIVGNFTSKTWNTVRDSATNTWNTLEDSATWNTVEDSATNALNTVGDFATNTWNNVANAGQALEPTFLVILGVGITLTFLVMLRRE